MSRGVKKSKCWCKPNSTWDKGIEEKFSRDAFDKDKRVYLPEINMRHSDIEYIKEAARRHNVTCSNELESIFERVFYYGMISFPVLKYRSRDRRRVNANLKKGEYRLRPRYKIHPSFIRLLKREAKSRKITITLLVYEIFIVYKQRFPIFLSSCVR